MRTKWGLILVIAASIGALWVIDAFLARTERVEVSQQASHDYETGTARLTAGRAADAVESLRRAHAMDRLNRQYTLQLAAALMEAGKLDEGERLLADLLAQRPNDGETNLAEARLLVRRGDWESAFAYYHRAIYGSWSSKAAPGANQILAVRLELANLLSQHGLQKDLLAEVLLLETEAANDPHILRQIARLYLSAGSPARAETIYRTLLRRETRDPELYNGLGDAELALGNYRGAAAEFQDAIRNGAEPSLLEQKIQLAANVAELDPTLRRLTSAEKFDRSVRILQLALAALKRCGQNNGVDQIAGTEKLLAARIRGNPANEFAEERLSTAERLWQMRLQACGAGTSSEDEPLRLVMLKIAQ